MTRLHVLGLIALIAVCGCTGSRSPLVHAVPPHGLTVALEPEIKGPSEPSYRTVIGETTRARSGDGGAVGWLIGSIVRTASESEGDHEVRRLSDSGCDERELLRVALCEQMNKAGYHLANDGAMLPAKLELKLHDFGLREVQRASAVPFATVSAKLIRPDGHAVWSVTAQSCGIQRQRVDNLSPEAYRAAFAEVAEDLAAQLIRGPIRPIETH